MPKPELCPNSCLFEGGDGKCGECWHQSDELVAPFPAKLRYGDSVIDITVVGKNGTQVWVKDSLGTLALVHPSKVVAKPRLLQRLV